MNEIYTRTMEIGSSSVDLYDNIRPAAMLQMLQELGTDHAAVLHMDRDYLVEEYHACWILARVWYRVTRPLHAGEQLTISTWHRGASSLIVYRDYDLFVGNEQVGEAVAAWVVADIDNRKMLRPSSIENIAISAPPDQVKERQLRLIRCPKDKKHVYDRTVRYSDLDVNGHMNNTRYADVLADSLAAQELEGRFISELQLNYSQECKEGETMEISRLLEENRCYIDGCSDDGKRRFEATVQFQPYR